ncbi:MAG: hypothetical protein CVU65_09530 [Deltaproteobacteria bacterium HGW-Deltaproteobacteria-22]|jgi:hypothetical protein|nr:MAG: hypothetical protein CVU65_09530 [Deltaproteobacteria bacterium HGW-Deltaproteobacteria-22]
MFQRIAPALLCCLLIPAACDEEKKITEPPFEQDPTKITLHGACEAEFRLGGFKVQMNEDMGYTAVDGEVFDGIVPGRVPEVIQTEGDCRLLKSRRLFCDPACNSGFTCGFEETCIPMPLKQDLGTVVIRGLVERLALKALQPGNSYSYNQLQHPGFEVDHVIQLRATTGYLGPFELYGVGVSQLVPTTSAWTLSKGENLVIEWTPPPEDAKSRIYLEINIDQHGLTPLVLSCNLPDTGAATIPSAIIDGLMDAGVTGYPAGSVTRRTEDSLTVPQGCMEFFVTSWRSMTVNVVGHTPCTNPGDCTPPEVCDMMIQQCYTPCDGPEDCTPPATCNAENKCE